MSHKKPQSSCFAVNLNEPEVVISLLDSAVNPTRLPSIREERALYVSFRLCHSARSMIKNIEGALAFQNPECVDAFNKWRRLRFREHLIRYVRVYGMAWLTPEEQSRFKQALLVALETL